GPAIERALGVVARLQLTEKRNTRRPRTTGEGLRVVERKKDRLGLAGDHGLEKLRLAAQGPGDEAAADPLVAGSAELTLEPSRLVAVTATQQSEATGTRHRRRELATGDPIHWCTDDRMPDLQSLAQPGRYGHLRHPYRNGLMRSPGISS